MGRPGLQILKPGPYPAQTMVGPTRPERARAGPISPNCSRAGIKSILFKDINYFNFSMSVVFFYHDVNDGKNRNECDIIPVAIGVEYYRG